MEDWPGVYQNLYPASKLKNLINAFSELFFESFNFRANHLLHRLFQLNFRICFLLKLFSYLFGLIACCGARTLRQSWRQEP
jgi:hypothetical protein